MPGYEGMKVIDCTRIVKCNILVTIERVMARINWCGFNYNYHYKLSNTLWAAIFFYRIEVTFPPTTR